MRKRHREVVVPRHVNVRQSKLPTVGAKPPCTVQSTDGMHAARRDVGARQNHPPIVRVVSTLHNVDNDKFDVEIEFDDVTGQRKSCIVARSTLSDVRALSKRLEDRGAVLPADRKSLSEDLQRQSAWNIRRVTCRTGWHGNDCFVLPRAILGHAEGLEFGTLETGDYDGDGGNRGADAGSLDAWRAGLREPLRNSSYLTFVVALQFAAPIAALNSLEETAAFHFSGESGTGKTLGAKVAESTIGRAREADLPTLNQTSAALNDLMARYDATLLTINEVKAADAIGGAKKLLSAVAHAMTSGSGRNRSDYAKQASGLEQKTWCVFGMTNMEHSLETLSRGVRDAGERARHIDVPVPPIATGGIFDRLKGSPAEITDRSRALARLAAETVDKNYGVAFPTFIEVVVRRRRLVSDLFNRDVERFIDRCAPGGDNWERRYARKFGYVYAAGLAAMRAGVMPRGRTTIRLACRDVYRSSRAMLTSPEERANSALTMLLTAVADQTRFPQVGKDKSVPADFETSCDGFRRVYPGHGDCLAIPREVLRSWAVDDAAFDRLVLSLKTAGAHVPGTKGDLTRLCALKGADRHRYVVLKVERLLGMAI